MGDNVAGAAGRIAAERVAKAAPDGYTLGFLNQAQLVVNPSLQELAYDPMKDFAPVSQVSGSSRMLVVHNAMLATNLPELIKLANARPGGGRRVSGEGCSEQRVLTAKSAARTISIAGNNMRRAYRMIVASMEGG